MNNKLTSAVAAVAALALIGGPAVGSTGASELPEHGHVMLLGAVWTGSGPGTEISSYERCVDLANGRALKNHAHHATIHTGTSAAAVKKSGHLVLPTAPLAPEWLTGCAAIATIFGK
jgi:hypothetical protein